MIRPSAPGITLEGVSLSFEGRPLFEGLDLHVPAGRTTCLLGPSGCGKSTLLRLMAGAPGLEYTGSVRMGATRSALMNAVAGAAPAAPVAPVAPVAWMSQGDLLLPWLSLLDNVLLGARLRGELTAARRNKALELIGVAGLAGREGSLPAALSGGMRQRAALLRTLMEDRPVILMDEPFSALDALTRLRLQDLAAKLTAGATVVLVTHDPMEALRLGHRIVLLGGQPARVLDTLEPGGDTPRDPGSPELAAMYSAVLGRLMGTEAA